MNVAVQMDLLPVSIHIYELLTSCVIRLFKTREGNVTAPHFLKTIKKVNFSQHQHSSVSVFVVVVIFTTQ